MNTHTKGNLLSYIVIHKHYFSTLLFALMFLFIGTSYASAKIDSNPTISLPSHELSLQNIMDAVESQSSYLFVYKSNQIETEQRVKIPALKTKLGHLLRNTCSSTGLTYTMNEKNIVLSTQTDSQNGTVQQEEVQIKGHVKDYKDEPIIGASILVKGSTHGTITDFDGNFVLSVPNDAVLKISYLGFKTTILSVGNKRTFNIVLVEDSEELNEVIVVGYGTQKKANLTGSVSQIDSKQLNSRPLTNVSSGLQGLMPGVTITSGQGRPGEDAGSIRVRGVGTLNNASPYILIDGIESGTLNSLDPNDIESISVLKDASSAAIYGSKASNGVILVTTKRGTIGKPKITYSGYLGFQTPTSKIDRLSSYDYARLYNGALEANGKVAKYTNDELQKFKDGSDPLYPNTDWYDLAYKTGVQTHHNVQVTGGTQDVKYMASAGYLSQTGILPHAGRNQFNGRTNLDLKLSEKLKVGMNMSFINNSYSDPNSSYESGSSDQIIRQVNLLAPWIPNKLEDGSYGTVSDGNPIAWLDLDQTIDTDNENFSGLLSAEYNIIKDLDVKVSYAYISNDQHYKAFKKDIQYNSSLYHGPNQLNENFYHWERHNFDAILNYKKSFGNHNLKTMLGFHSEKYDYRSNTTERKNFPNNDLTDMNAGEASTQLNSGYTRELGMVSYFGRVNYDYKGKYLAEANFRADASSRFAKDERWGYFPSFSAAWRISEEAFMQDVEWLDNLKIRASWGLLGNQAALNDYYPALNTYALGADYTFGDKYTTGYSQNNYKLSTISWEKARTIGIGIDFGFLRHFNGSLDYYDRKTTDIIMSVPVPSEFALGDYKDNAGSMSNKGLELSLGYNNNWGDWSFSANANVSYNKNEILDLGGVDRMIDSDNIKQVGSAVNSFYVYKASGLFQTDDEATAYMTKYKAQSGYPFSRDFKAGDLIYVDTNKDGKMTSEDRVITDPTDPKYTFGLNLSAGYRNFDLSAVLTGTSGVSRYFNKGVYGAFSGDNSHPSTVWLDAWSPTNTGASFPRVAEGESSPSSSSNTASTFWIQDASYVRLKTFQIGYTLPKEWLTAVGLSKVRIYYSGENLLTFDSMDVDVDPESPSGRGSNYPLIQTNSFGVNITF